jgi:ribosome-binding protein aMBF1 (putative translation factor)
MKVAKTSLTQLLGNITPEEKMETRLSFLISNRIDSLMAERGLSKKQFADAIGRKPSEVTKWLSGEHNFTLKTIAFLSAFFGESLINVTSSTPTK